jgi:CelD/BcsL family acetyltransferase involved in cellulose biosynthesis
MRSGPSEILTSRSDVEPIVEEWRQLLSSFDGSSYFSTPDWMLGWWETFGDHLDVQIAVWRGADSVLHGIAPLARTQERLHPRLPWTVSAWAILGTGVGAADHCAIPVRPDRVNDVRAWLEEKADDAPMILSNLDPELGRPLVPPSARRVSESCCPRLDLDRDGEHPAMSGHFRKRIRMYHSKLTNKGVAFRWVPPEEMDASILLTVFELHARRRALKNGTTTFTKARMELHERLIHRSGPPRGPAVVIAEHEGRPVGALYGFLWRDVFAYYQSGWEPEWARASMGTVLVKEAIRLAQTSGARIFDFLRGAEEYKYRFGSYDRVDTTWIVPTGMAGRVLGFLHKLNAQPHATNGKPSSPARAPEPVSLAGP